MGEREFFLCTGTILASFHFPACLPIMKNVAKRRAGEGGGGSKLVCTRLEDTSWDVVRSCCFGGVKLTEGSGYSWFPDIRLRLYMWERLILEIIHKRAFPSKILPKRLCFATIGGVLIALTIDDSRYARVASMAIGLLQSFPPLFIVCTTCLQSSSKTLTVD